MQITMATNDNNFEDNSFQVDCIDFYKGFIPHVHLEYNELCFRDNLLMVLNIQICLKSKQVPYKITYKVA